MKNLNKILFVFALMLSLAACQDDDHSFGDINTPQEIDIQYVIQGKDNGDNPNGDGSGLVDFTAKSENAISYKYIFSDGSSANAPSGEFKKRFNTNGTNTYTVTVIASGKGGLTTTKTEEITVFSNFKDAEAVQFLTGGTSKKWYIAANVLGHLGVGPNDGNVEENFYPKHYSAPPFDKATTGPCLYNNEITFSLEGELLKFEQNNFGSTFFNAKYLTDGGGAPGTNDQCLTYDTSGKKTVILSPSESILMTTNPTKTRGTAMTISDNGFMAYYIRQTTYEILSITDNKLEVRAIMGDDPTLAWYLTFTTTKPVQGAGPGPDEDFTNLVWFDEFDVAGAPNPAKWKYDLGTGQNGWGNNEKQTYTDASANSKVENGKLVITAKRTGDDSYTSARLKTEGIYDFKYGKVEFSAKLPTGGGTWPALWMLGANYASNKWPRCGEIDVMEHKGNFPNIIHGTLHYPIASDPNVSANNTATKTITNASTEFHKYSVIWTATSVKIYVDDQLYHSVANNSSLPFNANFFLIMNVAMGGDFGGAIDSSFTQSSMEVEYVRVYQ